MANKLLCSCCFCDELASGVDNDYMQVFGSAHPRRIIVDTQSLVLLPSLGPITEGHLLLLTKEHLNSFAELDYGLRSEAIDAIGCVKNWLVNRLGPLVIFEHGTKRGALTGACGITHAHIHFVPVGTATIPLPITETLTWYPVNEHDFLSVIHANGGDQTGYLFFENENGERYFSLSPSAPSQFMRQHVARLLGNPCWNWRDGKTDERTLAPLKWTPRVEITRTGDFSHNGRAGL